MLGGPTDVAKSIPDLRELIKLKGDPDAGARWFAGKANCKKCHALGGLEPTVGPRLDAIGAKLSRDAIWEAILYPSAAVSHGFESYTVVTDDGKS